MTGKKNLIILITAFNPSQKQITVFGQKRTDQYVKGLEKIGELAKIFPGFDYVLADNTIQPGWEIPESISKALEKIPNLKKIFFYENELGSINKGSGVIVDLKHIFEAVDLENYEYCIYYEPRQYLTDFRFFEKFSKVPGNYARFEKYRLTASAHSKIIKLFFKIFPIYKKQVNISLFSLRGGIWKDYLKQADERRMAEKRISMEDDLYGFIKNKNVQEIMPLGVVWHSALSDEYINY